MKSFFKLSSIILLSLGLFGQAQAADPAVKKSSTGICHDQNSPNYKQIKEFTPFKSLKACVASGGVLPAGTKSAADSSEEKAVKAGKTDKLAKEPVAETPVKAEKASKAESTVAVEKPVKADSKKSSGGVGPVKLSKNGICHSPGTEYYDRTKEFDSYPSLAACLKAGGREPK